jgi:hypothetical protein
MKTLNNDNRKIPLLHNTYLATTTTTAAATIITLAIIFASTTITPVSASTTGNTTMTTTTTTSSSGIELSPQPVLQLRASTTGVTPINQTHIGSTFSANGTLTLPNTTETINITTNGSALTSLTTQSAIGKETIMTQDGETATATFYEIVELTPTGGANGIAIAVLHTNSTGRLAPLNGMIVAATDYMQPIGEAITTFWEWIPSPPSPPPPLPPTTTMEESPPSPMNTTTTTTTTTDATTDDSNATAATEEEVVEEAVGGAQVAE